ncbi:hypothetical protein L3X38_022684 [Prunus dulcis]|uniref:endo-polygalacturonase n=1 Tax=Prunus dulcis TaxID=3755 RepID=A0AAD4VWG1_PRUDU|nr:hypothetical protein L3X38_022684 [Prunus dulcis]
MKKIFVLILIFWIGFGHGQRTFNVLDYGAAGDGKTDDSKAFLKAWGELCGAADEPNGVPTLVIPEMKAFLLQPIKFRGPCNSNGVHVQIMGKLVAPKMLDGWTECESDLDWLQFKDVSNLVVDGSGEIDGQGSSWWTTTNQYDRLSRKLMMNKQNCKAPDALHFHGCDNLKLSGLTHLNSARAHIAISGCNNVYVSHLTITAPEDSPNTDGIDISNSRNVFIQHSAIGTGDDCIAINGGCSDLNIANIACGPGHGISVGSLGANGALETVQNVYVRDSSFSGTTNGARIKTWQGGSGYAKNITFEKITLDAAKNPIIIDQFYCNNDHNCKSQASALLVEDVKYIDFEGTSANEEAIKLDCDQNSGCRNIIMDRIKITSAVPDKKIYASCNNAIGTSIGTIVPNVPCLKSGTEPTTSPPATPPQSPPLPATPPSSPHLPATPPPLQVMPPPLQVMPPPLQVMPPPLLNRPRPTLPLPTAPPPVPLLMPLAPLVPTQPPPTPPPIPQMSFTGEPGVPDIYFTPGASSATKLHKKHYIWCQLLILYVLTRLLFG